MYSYHNNFVVNIEKNGRDTKFSVWKLLSSHVLRKNIIIILFYPKTKSSAMLVFLGNSNIDD